MKSYWRKRLTAIALVCLMVLMMVPETALSVYAADEDEILVGAEEIVEQDAEVPEEAVELPEISEVYPETLEGSEEEFVEENAEKVIIEDAPVILEEEAEPEIQSEVPEIYDEEIEVADPAAVDGIEAAEAEELTGAADTSATVVVKKEWADGAGNHTNDTVTAVIKRGGTVERTVTLDSSNGWKATVTGLPAGEYSVEETNVTLNDQGEVKDVTEKYKATVTHTTPSTSYVWEKKNIGSSLTGGEIYVFTYTSNRNTYALMRNGTTVVGSTSGLTSGNPKSDISDDYMWTVTKNGSKYRLKNEGNDQYLSRSGNNVVLSATQVDVAYTSPSGYMIFEGDNLVNGRSIRVNGASISNHTALDLFDTAGEFTPYLLTKKITTTEYTITNTARDEFYVYHTGVDGGNIETRYIGGSSNDLTLHLTENTLYGGYYLESGLTKPADEAAYDGSNWTFTNAETEYGTAITPVAGETYYVKEVPITYLKPVTYVLYDTTDKVEGASNCKGRLQRLFAMAAVDDEQYSSIGFDIDGGASYDDQSAYTQFVVTKGGQPYKTYTASNVFGVQGNLAVANMSSLLQEDLSYTMTPYWITKDGIKVTSVYQYAQSIGDGYHYGWVSPGITKAMTRPGSTLTPQNRTLNTRKLTLSRYVFNDDEPDPTETVNPPETVEPTTVPTETVEPEPTTEPTTAPTETVEPEPTTVPTEEIVEPTAAPEEETVKPTETPAPTTAPTTPSSSSMNNTTPSGVIAKLLRMLGSLFK